MNRKLLLRKKIMQNGAESLSDAELLEFLILHSGAGEDEIRLLLSGFGNIKYAADAPSDTLTSLYGLNISTAVLLKLIPAICHEKSVNQKSELLINSSEKAKKYFENFFTGYSTEHFTAVALSSGMWVSDCYVSSSESASETHEKCRNIVRFALKTQQKSIIIAHNHPDSAAEASQCDISATKKIIAALKPLGILLIDHIIIGKNSSLSLRETFPQLNFGSISGYKTSDHPNYYK